MEGRRGARSFEAVERRVESITGVLSAQARLARGRGRSRFRGRLAQLYVANRSRAVREILEGPPPPCLIPLEELHRHFRGVFARDDARGDAPRPAGLDRLPPVASHAVLDGAFSAQELSEKRRRLKDSAPGPDEIQYSLLKKWDPKGEELAKIFEDCRRFRHTPTTWKRARASLKFKRGDPNEPSNWRPLDLCNTMYKLYAKCLAGRITQWAQAGKALSPQQKGFQAEEGCTEHRFLLQSVLDVAHRSGRECAMAWLDLADAYSSIPHCHIFETLQEFGMPEDFLRLLRELYEGWTLTIKVSGRETPEIPLRTGLKQGCPLSPIMFKLAIEPLLRFIDGRSRGFSLYGERVCVLAYADDLLLVAENAEELQAMLNDATAAADWIGLRFNAQKCKSLHFKGGAHYASEFTVQREAITCLGEEETVKYLWVAIGF